MRRVLLLLFLSTFAFAEELSLRHVYLTWREDPRENIFIHMQGLNTSSELTVYYDTKSHEQKELYPFHASVRGKLLRKLPGNRLIYHVRLTDLKPGQHYYFRVADQEKHLSKEYCFKTLCSSPPYLFVEGGDWENTKEAALVAKRAAAENPDALFLGGDYPTAVLGAADFGKWDEWLDCYEKIMVTKEGCMIPFVMAIGNHEVIGGFGQTAAQAPFFFDYFCPGKSYFSLPLGDRIRLFVLDSGHAEKYTGEQLHWLEKELYQSQDIPLKIALYHVPLYPSIRFVEKGLAYKFACQISDMLSIDKASVRLYSHASAMGRKYWLPLFDRYGMNVAFEHHDQTLKRTKPLRGGEIDPHGTLYLGDGGWGPRLQYPPIQGYFHKYFAALRGKQHFFWLMHIEEHAISYSAISIAGEVLDRAKQTY